jgi:hypothetical protein
MALNTAGVGEFKLSRRLSISLNGIVNTATLSICAPRSTPANNAWACECGIEGIIYPPRKIYGEDALDALLNCLSFCRDSLRDFCTEDRLVWWLEQGDEGAISLKDLF